MSNNIDILRTAILVYALICFTIAKYNQEETLTIQTKQTTIDNFHQAFFPPNGDQQIMVLNYNLTDDVYIQTLYDFNGTVLCERHWIDTNVQFIAWPLLTTGLYHKRTTAQVLKSTQPCDNPSLLHSFQSPINAWRFSTSHNNSHGIFFSSGNLTGTIDEYDLVGGNITRSFTLQAGERVNTIYYSSSGEFLFVQVSVGDVSKKVVVFDTASLERLRQVDIDYTFGLVRGENSENRFLAIDMIRNIYSVDEKGDTVIVFNSTSADNRDIFLSRFCTDDDEYVTLREGFNNTTRVISYNMLDGDVIQDFVVNFTVINVAQSLSCNNEYLSLVDQRGVIHVFYTADVPDDDDDDDDNNNQGDGQSFPTWAIVVIVIVCVMIVGGIVWVVIKKRREKAGQYRRFSNQMKQPRLLD